MLNIFYDPICETESFVTQMPELENPPTTKHELSDHSRCFKR
jgi:hypothetical protein